jgi:hypothetical protein
MKSLFQSVRRFIEYVSSSFNNLFFLAPQRMGSEDWKGKLSRISEKLIAHAVGTLKSMDNVSVMIVMIFSNGQSRRGASVSSELSPVPHHSSSTTHPQTTASVSVSHSSVNNNNNALRWKGTSGLQELDNMADSIASDNNSFKKSSSTAPSSNQYSNTRGTTTKQYPPVKSSITKSTENDDDFLDFLKDDKNFFS